MKKLELNVDAKTRDFFLTYSKTSQFQTLLSKTQKILRCLLKVFHTPSVSVSGGKDSLVLLDLCLKIKPLVHIWHFDYGIYMPRPIEEEVLKILTSHFSITNLHVDKRYSQNPNSSVGYKAFFSTLHNYLRSHKIDLCLIGLRKEESIRRKVRCQHLIEEDTFGYNAFPLRDWSWKDVWAYIVLHRIAYPHTYDQTAKLTGWKGWKTSRFVTFFDPEFAHLGAFEQDKFLFWKVRN